MRRKFIFYLRELWLYITAFSQSFQIHFLRLMGAVGVK